MALKTKIEHLEDLADSINAQITANEVNLSIWNQKLIVEIVLKEDQRLAIRKEILQAETQISNLKKTLAVILKKIEDEQQPKSVVTTKN